MKKAFESFMKDALIELMNNKVELHFVRKRYLPEGHSGEFNYETPHLKVATWKKEEVWFGVFIHEYCHFLQWKLQTKAWVAAEDSWFLTWLEDNTMKIKLEQDCYASQVMEQECDSMVLDIIKKYKLPIDIDIYTQQANAYHIGYQAMKHQKAWFKKGSPYVATEVWQAMPTKLVSKATLKNPPAKLLDLIYKHNF